MAWEKRGTRKYFYRSVRVSGHVRKVYFGAGSAARIAADAHALHKADRAADEQARRTADAQLDATLALTRDLTRGCELLAAATLLAAGFHRPFRHPWRRKRHASRTRSQTA